MDKTEWSSVSELEDIFDKYMVSFKTDVIGQCECGAICKSIMDLKSKKIYLERYNSISDSMDVYSFDVDEYPEQWNIDEVCIKNIKMSY